MDRNDCHHSAWPQSGKRICPGLSFVLSLLVALLCFAPASASSLGIDAAPSPHIVLAQSGGSDGDGGLTNEGEAVISNGRRDDGYIADLVGGDTGNPGGDIGGDTGNLGRDTGGGIDNPGLDSGTVGENPGDGVGTIADNPGTGSGESIRVEGGDRNSIEVEGGDDNSIIPGGGGDNSIIPGDGGDNSIQHGGGGFNPGPPIIIESDAKTYFAIWTLPLSFVWWVVCMFALHHSVALQQWATSDLKDEIKLVDARIIGWLLSLMVIMYWFGWARYSYTFGYLRGHGVYEFFLSSGQSPYSLVFAFVVASIGPSLISFFNFLAFMKVKTGTDDKVPLVPIRGAIFSIVTFFGSIASIYGLIYVLTRGQ